MPNPTTPSSDASAKLLPELFTLLQPQMKALDQYLVEQIDAFETEIREQVEYCIDTSGKRIRPSLIFFSGWKKEGHVDPQLVKLAAIIEIIHLATLVHDDIMDGADLRRNRDTVSKKWGSAAAVLLGDALFSHAVFLSTQFPTTEICQKVSESMRQVCTGEILQTMQRGNPDISLETYHKVINLKTAELFWISCKLAARLASEDHAYVTAAGSYGRHLGIAFQIYDDLTDLFGSQEKIGKTLGTDIATGKATLPLILMRDRLPAAEAQTLRDTLAGKQEADIPYWLNKLSEMGIFEEVRQTIFQEIDKACQAIQPYARQPGARYLLTLSQLLRNQAHILQSENPTS